LVQMQSPPITGVGLGGKLWEKGEASGNIQKIKGILIDCDCDALMFVVEQKGNVCHKGKETCFHSKLKEISSLEEIQLPLCW